MENVVDDVWFEIFGRHCTLVEFIVLSLTNKGFKNILYQRKLLPWKPRVHDLTTLSDILTGHLSEQGSIELIRWFLLEIKITVDIQKLFLMSCSERKIDVLKRFKYSFDPLHVTFCPILFEQSTPFRGTVDGKDFRIELLIQRLGTVGSFDLLDAFIAENFVSEAVYRSKNKRSEKPKFPKKSHFYLMNGLAQSQNLDSFIRYGKRMIESKRSSQTFKTDWVQIGFGTLSHSFLDGFKWLLSNHLVNAEEFFYDRLVNLIAAIPTDSFTLVTLKYFLEEFPTRDSPWPQKDFMLSVAAPRALACKCHMESLIYLSSKNEIKAEAFDGLLTDWHPWQFLKSVFLLTNEGSRNLRFVLQYRKEDCERELRKLIEDPSIDNLVVDPPARFVVLEQRQALDNVLVEFGFSPLVWPPYDPEISETPSSDGW
jgi:hypothetical protein